MTDPGSVTNWIEELKAGDASEAQQQLWNRYFTQLVSLARRNLGEHARRIEDEEDAVLGALNTFFRRIEQGQFPRLSDRSELWPLLATITIRKALNQRRKLQRQAKFPTVPIDATAELMGTELDPRLAVETADLARQLLSQLESDDLRQVAEMKLAGHTNAEIARQQGVIERTIERRLVVIRNQWATGEADRRR